MDIKNEENKKGDNKKLENKIITMVVIFLLGLFLGSYYSYKIFSNIYFQFLLFLFVIWVMSINVFLSAIIAVLMLIAYQLILKVSINEGFVPHTENESEFLNKPLLKNDELEPLGDNIDFTLITPKMNNQNLIKEGKKLLNNSNDLENDLKSRYDTREKEIMDNTRIIGTRMIKSGISGLEESINGEYYGDFLQPNKENPNLIYPNDKNLKNNSDYMTLASNNEIIKNEFAKLVNDKTLSREEFDKKYQEIKDMQEKFNYN